MKTLKTITTKTMLIKYWQTDSGQVTWSMVPITLAKKFVPEELKKPSALIQAKLVGDDYPKGFVTGSSMQDSQTVSRFEFRTLRVNQHTDHITVVVTLDAGQVRFTHTAIINNEVPVIETFVTVQNMSPSTCEVEMLSSVVLANISPLAGNRMPGNLLLTRFRSKWAMEGRPVTEPIEKLQLEPSWKPSGVGIEKFGQVGSMPVRGYFPTAMVSDRMYHCTWGIKLDAPSSWQIEAFRIDDDLRLVGGLADRDFGHWLKMLTPSEVFETPHAYVTACIGDAQDAAYWLQYDLLEKRQTASVNERLLPISYNNFCSSWGQPTADNIVSQLARANQLGVTYFVIDAGWYSQPDHQWNIEIGDWQVSDKRFPNGLAAVTKKIQDAGMVPGLWIEPETVGRAANAFNETAHLLKRDGIPLTVGDRRFWDMTDSWVIQRLHERLDALIERAHIGYLKIDYNENFGFGFDANVAPGEAARRQLSATLDFIRSLQEKFPELIIENCSSGGHRLESTFMRATTLSSFSDAHEPDSIPIIAAQLQLLTLPAQTLIWAVIRPSDSLNRIEYSLCAAMMGRVCLSGDLTQLNNAQMARLQAGLIFANQLKPIVEFGRTRVYGQTPLSYDHPTGTQAIVRWQNGRHRGMMIAHAFERPETLVMKVPAGTMIQSSFGVIDAVQLEQETLSVKFTSSGQAVALLLKCTG